jgi:putative tryptophan/tyrosine transport system substrate-binding protein
VRRREFLRLVSGLATVWPVAAGAQQTRRIGLLGSGAENDPEMQARIEAVRLGLARFGWHEGQNIHVEYRYASANPERAQAVARELIALRPDLVVAFATMPTRALQRESKTVPIVFTGIPDPIGAGFITSLARPGGNLTGTLLNEPGVVGKWLSMLKEMTPGLASAAVLFNPETSPYRRAYGSTAEAVARSLAVELVPMEVAGGDDIERAMAQISRTPNSGLLVPPDLTAALHRDRIIGLAARHRVPAVYQARFWVTAGGLMSYGVDRIVAHRQAAYYVDQILRGAKPADIPVQAPTKYETTINLKTTKALGLTIPAGLLVAADEIIE